MAMSEIITIQPYDFPSLVVTIWESFGQLLYYTNFIFIWQLKIALHINSVPNINSAFQNKLINFKRFSIVTELVFSIVGTILSASSQQYLFSVFSTISAGKAIYDGYFELIAPPSDENGESKVIEINTIFDFLIWTSGILAATFEYSG